MSRLARLLPPRAVSLRATFDLPAAALATLAGAGWLLLRPRPTSRPPGRRVLVINPAYSLSVLRARQAEYTVTHRDLDGYFEHVWSVHPLVGASPDEPEDSSVGPTGATRLAERHTFIEGRVARSHRLVRLPLLNFALAQVDLLLRLDSILKREGVSLVRAWDPLYSGLLAAWLAWRNQLPLEVRINANYDAIYESVGVVAFPRLLRWHWLEKAISRFTLSRADQVVVGSEDNRDYALANGAHPERIAYSGNWLLIHPDHLQPPGNRPRLRHGLATGDGPLAVAVCRLERVKHPEDVLRAVARARESNDALRGALIGDGSLRGELEDLADRLGLTDHFLFTGDRDQAWVASALSDADVVLAPLAGLSLVEAALSGTPIVAYDVEWHGELLSSEEDALLVPYRDTDAMAAALCRLLNDSALADRLAASARDKIERKMDRAALLAHERAQADRVLARRSARLR